MDPSPVTKDDGFDEKPEVDLDKPNYQELVELKNSLLELKQEFEKVKDSTRSEGPNHNAEIGGGIRMTNPDRDFDPIFPFNFGNPSGMMPFDVEASTSGEAQNGDDVPRGAAIHLRSKGFPDNHGRGRGCGRGSGSGN